MKLFTVGPVEMYPETLSLGKEPIPYFRNTYFSSIMNEIDNNLKKLFEMQQDDKNIILTASGTGAMEAVLMNCFNKNDKLLVISGGSFGHRFEQLCKVHQIPFDSLIIEFGTAFDEKMLEPYDSKEYTAMLVNIHETSIGQLYPIDILSDFCQKNQMYFIVDAISSAFADEIAFTRNKIDALIFSSQKALALAPGIAVVSLSARLVKKINPIPKSMYFDFNDYLKNGTRGQTPFTPAIGIIVQMNQMLCEIAEIGIKEKIKKTFYLAEYFRNRLRSCGFQMPEYPLSNAMTPVWFGKKAILYHDILIEKYQMNVNLCSGELADKMFRVSHMGNLTDSDYDDLIYAMCEIRDSLSKN